MPAGTTGPVNVTLTDPNPADPNNPTTATSSVPVDDSGSSGGKGEKLTLTDVTGTGGADGSLIPGTNTLTYTLTQTDGNGNPVTDASMPDGSTTGTVTFTDGVGTLSINVPAGTTGPVNVQLTGDNPNAPDTPTTLNTPVPVDADGNNGELLTLTDVTGTGGPDGKLKSGENTLTYALTQMDANGNPVLDSSGNPVPVAGTRTFEVTLPPGVTLPAGATSTVTFTDGVGTLTVTVPENTTGPMDVTLTDSDPADPANPTTRTSSIPVEPTSSGGEKLTLTDVTGTGGPNGKLWRWQPHPRHARLQR